MRKLCSFLMGAVAFGAMAGTAQAGPTLVATIYGEYDTNGISDLASIVPNFSSFAQYGSTADYDTPALFFVNPTSFAITGDQATLLGYGTGTFNNGLSQLISLPNLPADSITEVVWGGGCSAGVLFCDDYDDEYNTNYGANPHGAPGSPSADCTLPNAASPSGIWYNFCAPTGNFGVTYTGTWGNGSQAVYSVFSPSSNASGGFVGWEGIDPNGWSENAIDDVHNGSINGVLANIYLGTPPPIGVPEPLSLSLFGAGVAGVAWMRRRKARKA
jgi:hypothetical protein